MVLPCSRLIAIHAEASVIAPPASARRSPPCAATEYSAIVLATSGDSGAGTASVSSDWAAPDAITTPTAANGARRRHASGTVMSSEHGTSTALGLISGFVQSSSWALTASETARKASVAYGCCRAAPGIQARRSMQPTVPLLVRIRIGRAAELRGPMSTDR
jgi:hypothetical protein